MKKDEDWRRMINEEGWGMKKEEDWRRMINEEGWRNEEG